MINSSNFILSFLFLFSAIVCEAQQNAFKLFSDNKSVEIPFDYEGGYILINVKLNGILNLKCIFDTGAQHTILFDGIYAEILGLQHERSIKIRGSDLDTYVNAFIYRHLDFELDNKYDFKKDLIILDNEIGLLNSTVGTNIDGIIGANFFQGLIVKVDYVKNKLTFSHPDSFIQPEGYEEIPIEMKQNKPYIKGKLSALNTTSLDVELLLDTGAPISFMLHTNTTPLLSAPKNAPSGILAYGLGGPILGYIGKVNELSFGSQRFKDLYTNFQEIDSTFILDQENFRHGMIGNTVLSKFDLIIDYMRDKLYVKQNKNFNREIKYDKSGITLFAYGKSFREYRIKHIRKNSPAEKAGLMEGDIIKRIGWWSKRWYSLKKIINKFSGTEGTKIKLTVQRGERKIKTVLTLKDPLNQFYNFHNDIEEIPILYSTK